MARYNKKQELETVINHQGGTSVKLEPKFELISLLANGLDNTFYEKVGEREQRFQELIKTLSAKDVGFVAKALVYARSVMGQRTVTHFGAAHLAQYMSGNPIAKRFYSKRNRKANEGGIIYRLDDMLEIIACYMHFNPNKPLPSAMKKGFALALSQADKYELAKYQGKGKQISLVDVINLVHPKPSQDMASVFKELMEGKLKQFNTVEDKNTKAGQEIAQKVKEGIISKEEAQETLKEAKEDNYRELITSGKIGYLALLRNIRNILNNTNEVELINSACKLLTDKDFIKKSLVFPYQIDLALEIILSEIPNSSIRNQVVIALNQAYETSIPNMSEMGMHGTTAVVIDSSRSMTRRTIMLANKRVGSKSAFQKGALIGATFAKGLNADLFHFADTCVKINYNPLDSIHTISRSIEVLQGSVGYGTAFNSISKLVKGYDRVFIISDMQGRDSVMTSFGNSHVYCVDIVGYGTTVIKPNSKVYQLFGYSSEMYELAKKVEIDPRIILKEIEDIRI